MAQLRHRGEIVDYLDVLNQILDRDHRDSSRTHGPLVIPKDAEVIDTTVLEESQVIDRIVTRAKDREERATR